MALCKKIFLVCQWCTEMVTNSGRDDMYKSTMTIYENLHHLWSISWSCSWHSVKLVCMTHQKIFCCYVTSETVCRNLVFIIMYHSDLHMKSTNICFVSNSSKWKGHTSELSNQKLQNSNFWLRSKRSNQK